MISNEDMEIDEEVAGIMENAPNATAEPPTPRPPAPLSHEPRDEDMPFYFGRSIEFAPKPIRPRRPKTPRPDWSPSSPMSPTTIRPQRHIRSKEKVEERKVQAARRLSDAGEARQDVK